MCSPESELVSSVNGRASIAAQAVPMKKYEPNSRYWLWMNAMDTKPAAPISRLTTYAVLSDLKRGITIDQRIEPTACAANTTPTQLPAAW